MAHSDELNPLERGQTRNEAFRSGFEPFEDNEQLDLNNDEVTGPVWFLNPTQATFTYTERSGLYMNAEEYEYLQATRRETFGEGGEASQVEYKWTSRNNRKGRHSLIIRETEESYSNYESPPASRSPKAIAMGIFRMFRYFSIWDVSCLVATAFMSGCVVLVLNAFLSFLPFMKQSYKLPNSMVYTTAALTVFGCTLFLTGSLLSFFEAVNADRKGCFGWKVHRISYIDFADVRNQSRNLIQITPNGQCIHHHGTEGSIFGHQEAVDSTGSEEAVRYISTNDNPAKGESWRLFPRWHDLCTYYIYDLGFLACGLLLCSSLIFWSASVVVLATSLKLLDVPRWVRIPQIIAGVGFTVSSALLALETQKQWWMPAPQVLGWHINFWNLIGSAGFTACAVFGYIESEHSLQWAQYQFGCSFLWGEYRLPHHAFVSLLLTVSKARGHFSAVAQCNGMRRWTSIRSRD